MNTRNSACVCGYCTRHHKDLQNEEQFMIFNNLTGFYKENIILYLIIISSNLAGRLFAFRIYQKEHYLKQSFKRHCEILSKSRNWCTMFLLFHQVSRDCPSATLCRCPGGNAHRTSCRLGLQGAHPLAAHRWLNWIP